MATSKATTKKATTKKATAKPVAKKAPVKQGSTAGGNGSSATAAKEATRAAQTTKAQTTKAQTTKAQTTKAQTTKAQTTNAQTTNAQTTKTQTTKAQTTKTQTTKAQTTKTQTTKAQTTKAQTTNAQTTNAQTTNAGNGAGRASKRAAPKGSRDAPGLHADALIEAVIERVQARGFALLGNCGVTPPKKPQPVPPAALAGLTFPDDKPLPPSLRRWLAYDASWLAWFEDIAEPVFEPLLLGAFAEQEFDMDWGFSTFEGKLPGNCFALHFGADSRRLLYVGEADSRGEYPVLVIDTDDVPYVGVEYPGFDVYLAEAAGLLQDREHETYGDLLDDPVYGARMQEHADRLFGGKVGLEEIDLLEGEGAAEGEDGEEDFEDLEELEEFDLSDAPDFGDDWDDDGYV